MNVGWLVLFVPHGEVDVHTLIFHWIAFYFHLIWGKNFTIILQDCKRMLDELWMNVGWVAPYVPHGEVDVHHNLIYTWSFNWIVFLKSRSWYLEKNWIQAKLIWWCWMNFGWTLDEEHRLCHKVTVAFFGKLHAAWRLLSAQ
jgi:hypothetical protein